MTGAVEKFLTLHKNKLEYDLAKICARRKVKKIEDLLQNNCVPVPAVERVVYSTCSVYQTENEDVIKSVLPFAKSLNFELVSPFPQWPHRGLPIFDGAEHLLRTDPKKDTEGFFIALFVKKSRKTNRGKRPSSAKKLTRQNRYMPCPFYKLSAFWFHKRLTRQGSKKIKH